MGASKPQAHTQSHRNIFLVQDEVPWPCQLLYVPIPGHICHQSGRRSGPAARIQYESMRHLAQSTYLTPFPIPIPRTWLASYQRYFNTVCRSCT